MATTPTTTSGTKTDDNVSLSGDGSPSAAPTVDRALSLDHRLASGFTSESINVFGALLGVLQGTNCSSNVDTKMPALPTAEDPASIVGADHSVPPQGAQIR